MKADYQEYRKIVVVPDKFKGSLSSGDAAAAVVRGIGRVWPQAEFRTVEIADGGDGSASVLERYRHTRRVRCRAAGPLGGLIDTDYLLYEPDGAFIEMARVCGLSMVPPGERNPMLTTTYGLGQVIRHAAERGAREIVLSLGGSATNDGGAGMLQALGYRFLDGDGNSAGGPGHGCMTGGRLAAVRRIDASGRYPGLERLTFRGICDVENPLLGPSGATRVFGPQKGAGPQMLDALEAGMENYADRCEREAALPAGARASAARPGAGAAGGMGYALAYFLGAELISGKRFFAQLTRLEQEIGESDLVITGEGRLDGQSFRGKVVDGVLELASRAGKPVWIFCGSKALASGTADGVPGRRLEGVCVRSLAELEPCAERSMQNAARLLERLARDTAERFKTAADLPAICRTCGDGA